MNPIWFDIGIAIVVLTAAVTGVTWLLNYKSNRSEWRMYAMMQRMGVDTSLIEVGDMENTIRAVRKRCRSCQAGDVCEQWLSGKFEGSNSFCPNARVFRTLHERHKQVVLVNA